jgi:hypothetical protein
MMRLMQVAVTLFTLILIPIYYQNYGLLHFLWISDVALFMTVLALWFKSRLMISMLLIYALPLELGWNLDFFWQVFSGETLFGLAEYMFDSERERLLRGLSLFHVFMPLIWFWLLHKWGYDRRGFKYAVILIWILLPVTYLLTEPEKNINWVFLYRKAGWDWMPYGLWPLVAMLVLTIFIFWPLHHLLKRSKHNGV